MIKEYICPWCGKNFKKDVFYEGIGRQQNHLTSNAGTGRKKSYSTQVVCPGCGRTIATLKREETENKVVGKKHIHLRY